MRTPPKLQIHAHTDHASHGEWTIPRVIAALRAHESGDYSTSALLADAVLRDPDIYAPLRVRSRALTARSLLPVQIEAPDGGDSRVKEAIRTEVNACYWDVFPECVTAPLHVDGVVMETALACLTWEKHGSMLWPVVHHLPLHGFSIEWNDQRKVAEPIYTDAEGTRHVVTPGDGRWLLHMPTGLRSFIHSAIRALAMPWILGHFTWRDWARFCEKHGLPIMLIEEPRFAHDDVLDDQTGSVILTGEENIKRFYQEQFGPGKQRTAYRLPQGKTKDDGGWKIKLLEYTADTSQSFDRMLERLKAQKSEVLLGRDVATASKASGDGAALVEGASYQALASDAEGWSTTKRNQVWKPFVRFNWGEKFEDSAPWSRWDLRAPQLVGQPDTETKPAKPEQPNA